MDELGWVAFPIPHKGTGHELHPRLGKLPSSCKVCGEKLGDDAQP